MVSRISRTDLARLIQGYRLYAKTEGKSDKTITIVANSVGYLEGFLHSEGLPTDVTQIGRTEIKAFTLYLQQKRCFGCPRPPAATFTTMLAHLASLEH